MKSISNYLRIFERMLLKGMTLVVLLSIPQIGYAAELQKEATIDITELPIATPQPPSQKGEAPFTLEPLEPAPLTPASVTPAEGKIAATASPLPAIPQKKTGRPKKSRRKQPNRTAELEQPLIPEEAITQPEETMRELKREETESLQKQIASGTIQLGNYLEPWKGTDPQERVEMNFDNKELTELLKFLSQNLNVTFILDDDIEPLRAEGLQPIGGTKITFKSHVPLTLKQAWEIGLTFLEMSGFSVIPSTQPRTYRVTVNAAKDKPSANREPLPTFIGTDPELLPNNDTKIRYVYFAQNAELPTIIQIIDALKSGSSGPLIEVPPLKAVIMTDKAANIKSIINILGEIDSVTQPETLAIIRLQHTDARQVRELYMRLIGKDPQNPVFNPFSRQRKPATTQYFTEATRVFEEPYTNSLIVLGTRENIKRFEDFVIKYIDKSLDIPFSPLHIIQLKFIDAASIAKILNDVIQRFNQDPANQAAAAVGGVRDGNKFFRPSVRITDEPSGNRLIINADYEEYLKLRELIEKLDVQQPQVAIKILIMNVDITDREILGTQLRNSTGCCDGTGEGFNSFLGKNVNFQTSNVGPFITNPPLGVTPTNPINGAQRLLGNLIGLANSVNGVSPFGPGTTLVTLGKDMFGFWGLLQALQSYTRVSVVANPFLITTHKYKAEFKVGETRRTTTAIVEGQQQATAQGDISADLRIIVTPQISYDDMVSLNIYVELGQFVDPNPASTNVDRLIRKVSTEALLANREVLALGGLIRDVITENTTKVPFLGDLPLIGWLFKQKSKTVERTSLLILVSPEIIKPAEPQVAQAFTFGKIADAKDTIFRMGVPAERRDPIHRWLFNDHIEEESTTLDKFVSTQQRYIDPSQKKSIVVAMHDAPSSMAPSVMASGQKKGVLDLLKEGKAVA